MTEKSQPNSDDKSLRLKGHTIAFFNQVSECQQASVALQKFEITEDRIQILYGDDGIEIWNRLLQGSQWGEAAEAILKEGAKELRLGHIVMLVEVHDADEAARVADLSTHFGGHGIYHFGFLVDTRLTP